MTLGKRGVHVNRVLVRVHLRLPVAEQREQLAEVEPCFVTGRMALDLLLVLSNAVLRAAPLFGQKRKIEMRQAHVGLLGDRRANLALGAVEISTLERHDTA